MLAAERALGLILETVVPLPPEAFALADARGLVLAESLSAPIDLPGFDNSAMDGYAVRAADLVGARPAMPMRLPLRGQVFAGDAGRAPLSPGTCALITTGAPLPPGADAVVPKEKIRVSEYEIIFSETVAAGDHVRRAGEDVRAGTPVLDAGERLGPGSLALLASLGFARVPVTPPPGVLIVPTGSELVPPGSERGPGQIYESNGTMLQALLARDGVPARVLVPPRDERAVLRATLEGALAEADVVLVSGGVSVGDRDFVREELKTVGIREIFWRVAIKPGKPFYFGTGAGPGPGLRYVFGLPGNPASAFVVFEEFIRPALRKMLGRRVLRTPTVAARLEQAVKPAPDRLSYLRARLARRGDRFYADPFAFQGSHGLAPLALANALVLIPPGTERLPAGTVVSARVLHGAGALLDHDR